MTTWAYWFHLAALAATAAAYWPMRKADAGAMSEFHKQGTPGAVAAWMNEHASKLKDLKDLLAADMRFLFCYPLLFVSMTALTGNTAKIALTALAAFGAGMADYIETSRGLSILNGGSSIQAAEMAKASKWKWRLFGFAAFLTAFALFPSAGVSGHREIANAIAIAFLGVCVWTCRSQATIAGLSFFAAAVTLAVAR